MFHLRITLRITKKEYYDALITAQRKRITQEDIIDKWLLFFLESIKTLTEKLDKKYDVFKQKGGYLNERQKLLYRRTH